VRKPNFLGVLALLVLGLPWHWRELQLSAQATAYKQLLYHMLYVLCSGRKPGLHCLIT
jgi:hypothetical protein